MDPISRYQIFCSIIETGSFTRTAQQLHYSQSAVSQSVQSLERDLGVKLVIRARDGIRLTPDGEQFYPFLQQIAAAESALARKKEEMQGLTRQTVTIGCFSSVGRHVLPEAIRSFHKRYPSVRFELKQGDYSDICRWVSGAQVDFGFVDAKAAGELPHRALYEEPLMAVLPPGHPLAVQPAVTLQELAEEPFILLDEGEYNSIRDAFGACSLSLREEYSVYDDYSILAMVHSGLGVSALFSNVLRGYETGVEVRPIISGPVRSIALVWKDRAVMPLAAARFMDELTVAYTGL